jgi:23S rRNA (adenine2503-C2)-methyltransferase
MKLDLKALNQEQLVELTKELREPSYRADQIAQWLHYQGVTSLEQISNLPGDLRRFLEEHYTLGTSAIEDSRTSPGDGSVKYLLRLPDSQHIEMVFLPVQDHGTLCLSTQVGCGLGCTFCATGTLGFRRHLAIGEILDQLRLVLVEQGSEAIRNVVFMGMGEPLLNLPAVLPALQWMRELFSIGRRRITVSTAGIPAGMRTLAESGLGIRLALSLNAPNDRLRSELMPINRQYPIKTLLAELAHYARATGERPTVEYVLIAGVNDSTREAKELLSLTSSLSCKINLIVYNPSPLLPYDAPGKETVEEFHSVMLSGPNMVTVRRSLGKEIGAACGQLAGQLTGDNP